jgi:D-alanyl-D-alanine carboxypeptidase/D-alanyl-D-alanine-endopeptidase (penicillin-binding protein 4)
MKAKMRKLLILAGFALCFSSSARADLAGQIDGIIRESIQKRVHFSIHIIKADSGETVYDHDAKELMIPASNMKIITGAAALHYLGPDYVYKTRVGLSGNALVVIGSGDPLLGDEKTDAKYGREPGWIFKDTANALKTKGIGTIEGIIVDSSVFDNEPVHPSWPAEDLNRWYACEVSGLNYNDNCIQISAKNIDGRIAIFVEPQTAFVSLINKVVPTSIGKSAIGTYRNTNPNRLTVFGKCKNEVGPFDVAIERPAAYFGFLLYENLAESDIDVKGELVEKTLDDTNDFVPLIDFRTPLSDCLARCNKNSLGLAAEAMFKTIAAMSNPDKKNGSWKKGQELISQFLLGLGLDKSQFYIDDGSGLSRQNELTAYAITTVLSDIYNSRNWQLYKDTLAVGGVDGTIEKYFKEEKYKGKILGKTGSITSVKSFSGLCVTGQGDYIFSILANNVNGKTRTVINDIAQAIIDEAENQPVNMTDSGED